MEAAARAVEVARTALGTTPNPRPPTACSAGVLPVDVQFDNRPPLGPGTVLAAR